jgi:hypothetical protein
MIQILQTVYKFCNMLGYPGKIFLEQRHLAVDYEAEALRL